MLVVAYLEGPEAILTLLTGGFVLLIVVIEFVFPLRLQGKSYAEKLEKQEGIEAQFDTLDSWAISKLGGRVYLVLLLAWFGAIFATSLGKREARLRILFPVLETAENHVVLRIYGDRLIAAPFETDAKEIERKFMVQALSATTEPLSIEAIGPLEPK